MEGVEAAVGDATMEGVEAEAAVEGVFLGTHHSHIQTRIFLC